VDLTYLEANWNVSDRNRVGVLSSSMVNTKD